MRDTNSPGKTSIRENEINRQRPQKQLHDCARRDPDRVRPAEEARPGETSTVYISSAILAIAHNELSTSVRA